MKRLFQWVFAATLIGGATLLTACFGSNDNPVDNVPSTSPSTPGIAEKIIGKWMDVEFDGQPALTSDKSVVTFLSPTKATYSISRTDFTETQIKWSVRRECDVEISGNKVTLTSHPEGNPSITLQEEYTISDITATEMVCTYRHTTFHDGLIHGTATVKNARLKKIDTDYRAYIIGLWECKGIFGGDTYNDANARLEFFDDGTYNFYRKNDAGYWESVTTREFQIYFVDGTLMATRWKDQGEDEHRECWEIKTLSGDEMVWTALRQNTDGSTFQQDVKWKKIDLNVAEKIIGKWMPVYLDGNPVVTDLKSVYTFVSATKAYMSVSINAQQGEEIVWNNQKELDLSINGNKMTLTNHSDEHTTMVEEFNITAIDGSAFTANHKITVTVDGSVMLHNEGTIRFEKLTRDYREAVLGLWECTELTGIETYNNANARLEFFADGTYKYWRKNTAGEWEAVTTREFQDYFVDGTLLATRWKNVGEEELREWWEIASIADGQMTWTALRANTDGSTAQQGMKWKRIATE